MLCAPRGAWATIRCWPYTASVAARDRGIGSDALSERGTNRKPRARSSVDRASDFGSDGRGFESLRARQCRARHFSSWATGQCRPGVASAGLRIAPPIAPPRWRPPPIAGSAPLGMRSPAGSRSSRQQGESYARVPDAAARLAGELWATSRARARGGLRGAAHLRLTWGKALGQRSEPRQSVCDRPSIPAFCLASNEYWNSKIVPLSADRTTQTCMSG